MIDFYSPNGYCTTDSLYGFIQEPLAKVSLQPIPTSLSILDEFLLTENLTAIDLFLCYGFAR
jgi:hypothetical protein